jgi:uncharacterized MnhB-related membrane protein
MEWIYNNYDLAITLACVGAVILTVIILAVVMTFFRSSREALDEEEGGVQ